MNATALHQDILNETYEDLKDLIYDQAHKKSRLFHMPFEDALSHAHFSYVRAVAAYKDGTGAKISTWVAFCLHNDLINFLKREYKHYSYEQLEEELTGGDEVNFFVEEFTEGLSDQARTVVQLILETPEELNMLLHWDGARNKSGVLRTVKGYLSDLGWVAHEIKDSLEEIRQALSPNHRTSEDVVLENNTTRHDLYCYAKVGLTRNQIKTLTQQSQ